jgi:hypothetical protein
MTKTRGVRPIVETPLATAVASAFSVGRGNGRDEDDREEGTAREKELFLPEPPPGFCGQFPL